MPRAADPWRSDEEVPLAIALRLLGALRSADVQLNIVKGGGHRLSAPHEIAAILRAIDGLLETEFMILLLAAALASAEAPAADVVVCGRTMTYEDQVCRGARRPARR